ncbi:MAG: DNA repair protein RecN [Propionibacteriaceae bacterium]|nr:DNA repair protein RecN [Propionibacteriaceae bacterium]
MLGELRIRNLGVIADALVEFSPGLTALTGETGAGKTMIVAGLGQLLGSRADAGVVRRGADKAMVEGRWSLGEAAMERALELGGEADGEELLTVRQVSASGRSRAFVGGAQTPVGVMAGLVGDWATIHGQSEQVRLGSPERQREVLDAYAAPEELAAYRRDFAEYRQVEAELRELREEALARAREIDVLRFGLDEIAAVDPQPGEDAALATEAQRLQAADDLRLLALQAQAALSGGEDAYDEPGAVGLIGQARKLSEQLARLDETALGLSDRVAELSFLANDLAADLSGYLADLPSDPLRLEAVTARRAELAGLTRKYGHDIAGVLAWAEESAERLRHLEGSDERIAELTGRLEELDAALTRSAERISADRARAAGRLADEVRAELAALAMPHARLAFALTPAERNAHGTDRVELLFSANPGAAPAPLSKVASGGELSRVRLALEVVLAREADRHTFVFDEVDAGVGGAVGLEIGRRLKRLAERSQVIVVTHLAQVAAFADRHLVVTKSSDGEVTSSDVVEVSGQGRAAELARMMAGLGDSSAALDHAVDLLRVAQG